MGKTIRGTLLLLGLAINMEATSQSLTCFTTTESKAWQTGKASLSTKAATAPILDISGREKGHKFKAWGTCFNELDLDALELLKPEEQEEVMRRIFAPDDSARSFHAHLYITTTTKTNLLTIYSK